MARRALTRRERVLVGVASVIFFSIVFLPAGFFLSRNYRETHGELGAAAHRLSEARELRKQILTQRKVAELIAKRVSAGGAGEFDLYNYTGSVLDRLGLKELARFKSLVPAKRLNIVSIDIEGIGLEDLVKLMYSLQHSDHLVALELLNNIEVAPDKKGLKCSIMLSSPRG